MTQKNCQQCGGELPDGANVCPHCGAVQDKPLPLALIGAFFVIGILLGLLFINTGSLEALQSRGSAVVQGILDSNEGDVEPQDNVPPQVEKPAESKPDEGSSTVFETLACNAEMARKVREKAREIAAIQQVNGVLVVRMRRPWDYYSPGIRRSFIEAFVESDACLEGRFREIRFYHKGEEIAHATAQRGIELYR